MAIKIWSIARDEWEAGDYAICSECGAHIRHVCQIDAQPYGMDCGANILGWTSRAAKKKMTRVARYVQSLRYFAERGNWRRAYSDGAYPIIAALDLPIPYSDVETVSRQVLEAMK